MADSGPSPDALNISNWKIDSGNIRTTQAEIPVVQTENETEAGATTDDMWHCQVLGQQLGPMLLSDVQLMVQHGELSLDDNIKRGPAGKWYPAGSVAELDEWHCQVLGQQLGSMPFADLKLMVAHGELSATDKVKLGVHFRPHIRSDGGARNTLASNTTLAASTTGRPCWSDTSGSGRTSSTAAHH